MSSGKAKEDWDFTPVINLLNSLSTNIEKPSQEASGTLSELPTVNGHVVAGESKDDKDDDDINSGLGNFDKLWKYLGQPLKIPSLNPEPQPDIDLTGNPTFQPIPDSCGNKGVRWRDEVEGADLADNDEAANTSDGLNSSKAQEKKERRRKWKENVPQRKSQANLFPSGSENESELDAHKPTRLLDRRAIIQDILHGPSQREKSFGNSFLKVPSKRQSLSDQEALPIAKPSQLRGTVAALFSIEQTDYAVAAERKAKLIKKLNASFVEERRFLRNICVSPLVNKNVTGMDAGIHVFVDASNVSIFMFFEFNLRIPIS